VWDRKESRALSKFAVEHLSEDRLAEAWPVVCMSHSHANADWWISESSALIGRGGGVLAARAADGCIHGIATYEVVRRALVGRVLAVATLVTFELSRRAPARRALDEALELLASAFDCRSIVLPPANGHAERHAKTLYGLPDPDPRPDLP
jgi:hypothetical protein